MVFDIIILLILVGSVIYGFRKGFVFTLIHTVGWIGALALAYIVTPFVETFLRKFTGLYEWLVSGFETKLDVTLDSLDAAMESLPSNISASFSSTSSNIIGGMSETVASIVMTILSFLFAFIVLKIVFWLLLRLFSKDYTSGFSHFFDGLFGSIFGFLKGSIIVILFFTLLVPIVGFLPADAAAFVEDSLNSSMLAGTLYNNNFLLLLLQNYFNS